MSFPTPASAVDARTAGDSADRVEWIKLSLTYPPPATPVSDAKVLTGVQKPLTEIAFVFCEIRTRDGHEGIGFGYSKRAGGPGLYAHTKELASHLLARTPATSRGCFFLSALGMPC